MTRTLGAFAHWSGTVGPMKGDGMVNYLAKSLDKLASMENNWDGRHSLAPTKQAIEVASVVCAVPLGTGGIQLELHAGGSDIEIEIGPTGVVLGVAWAKARLT